MARRKFGNVYKRTWRDKKTGERREDSRFSIRYKVAGKWKYEGNLASEKEAEALLVRRETELGHRVYVEPKAKRISLSKAMQAIRDDYKARARKSAPRLETSLGHLERLLGAGTQLAAITTERVREYVGARLAEPGTSHSSVDKELAALVRIFTLHKGVPAPRIERLNVLNTREGFFEVEEVDRLVALLREKDEHVADAVEFAALSAWRAGNVFGLKWDMVDFARGTVRAPMGTTKNGDPIEFYFDKLPKLATLLRRRRDYTTAVERKQGVKVEFVFQRAGRPIRDFRTIWKQAVEQLGVWFHQWNPRTLKRERRRPTFHGLRHTAAQHLFRAGVDQSTIQDLCGWRTASMFARYHIEDDRAKRSAVERLASHLESEREAAAKVVPLHRETA